MTPVRRAHGLPYFLSCGMAQDCQFCSVLPVDVVCRGGPTLILEAVCHPGLAREGIPIHGGWLRVQGTNQASRLGFDCVVGMQKVRSSLAEMPEGLSQWGREEE